MIHNNQIIAFAVSLSIVAGLLVVKTSINTYAQPKVECPCQFFGNVPMIPECWLPDTTDDPAFVVNMGCFLSSPMGDPFTLGVSRELDSGCFTEQFSVPDPSCQLEVDGGTAGLTEEEIEACMCELQAYATALNQVDGITVIGGPPYICDPNLVCAPPIPTLNQWGKIITMVVIGLFAVIGLIIMRRTGVATSDQN